MITANLDCCFCAYASATILISDRSGVGFNGICTGFNRSKCITVYFPGTYINYILSVRVKYIKPIVSQLITFACCPFNRNLGIIN